MTIKQIQLLLLYLGYSPGNPDGPDGPSTQAAVAVIEKVDIKMFLSFGRKRTLNPRTMWWMFQDPTGTIMT